MTPAAPQGRRVPALWMPAHTRVGQEQQALPGKPRLTCCCDAHTRPAGAVLVVVVVCVWMPQLNNPALHVACSFGHTDVVQALLEEGKADPNATNNVRGVVWCVWCVDVVCVEPVRGAGAWSRCVEPVCVRCTQLGRTNGGACRAVYGGRCTATHVARRCSMLHVCCVAATLRW